MTIKGSHAGSYGAEKNEQSPHFLPSQIKISGSRIPAYLYLKDRIFYYRYRISKKYLSQVIELRFSLHTPYKNQAAKMAESIHSLVLELLEASKEIYHRDIDIVAIKPVIKQAVKDEIEAMLAEPNKKPISLSEAKKKINGYLLHLLDQDLASKNPSPLIVEDGASINLKYEELQEGLSKQDGSDFVEVKRTLEKEKAAYDINQNALNFILKTGNNLKETLNTLEGFEDHYFWQLSHILKEGILKSNEISTENAHGIAKAMMLMKSNYIDVLKARWQGDYNFEKQFYIEDYTPFNQCDKQDSSMVIAKNADLKLSEVIEKYVTTNIRDGKWAKRTVADHRNRITALLEIIGDKSITEINRNDIREFRDTLRHLPPIWKEKSIKERTSPKDMAQKEYPQTLSIKSINVMVEAVSSMFAWAMAENLMSFNPATKLGLKDKEAPIDKRDPLTDEDIKKIFFSGDYKSENFINPAHYWCPLISLYTGMRLEEIAQLHCEDIYKEDDVIIFDIKRESNDGLHDKVLKTVNAHRKIPIHEYLIKLGLIEYLEAQKENGQLRLFNQLNKTDKSPKYGKQVGKQFQNVLKRLCYTT